MIKIIKECFSRSLNKQLKLDDKVSFSTEIEQGYIDSGFGVKIPKKITKEKKTPIKKK